MLALIYYYFFFKQLMSPSLKQSWRRFDSPSWHENIPSTGQRLVRAGQGLGEGRDLHDLQQLQPHPLLCYGHGFGELHRLEGDQKSLRPNILESHMFINECVRVSPKWVSNIRNCLAVECSLEGFVWLNWLNYYTFMGWFFFGHQMAKRPNTANAVWSLADSTQCWFFL